MMKRKPSNREELRRLRKEYEDMSGFLDRGLDHLSQRVLKLETAVAMIRDQSKMVATLAQAVEHVQQQLNREWVYHAQVRQVLQEAVNVHWPRWPMT